MRNKLFLSVVVLFGSLALSGCLEDFEVTLHEPAIYKGPADPFVEKGSQVGMLQERFTTVQTDR